MEIKVNSKHLIHAGRVFNLYSENISTNRGVTFDLELIDHPGAAAIVPMRDDGTVLLLSQYRHAVGQRIWEIPAGTLDLNETPEACARRELVEETGFDAHRWKKLGEIMPLPGYSDERIHLFLADKLSPAKQAPDEDEILEVHPRPFTEALEMIYTGQIQDAKSICGLLFAARIMNNLDNR
jgi:ADP-ribose pyrophosphatase